MEFDGIFEINSPPVPIIKFRLGDCGNVKIPGGRNGQYWELPSGVDIDQTSFLRLGQPWLGFFAKGDIFQIEHGERLPQGFFDVMAVRLPSGRIWLGYVHKLPGDRVILRASETLTGALTYDLSQVEILGQVLRVFRGVTRVKDKKTESGRTRKNCLK